MITLLAIGSRKFMQFAYQMAISIKYHNPGIRIQLVCEADLINSAPMQLFDVVTVMDYDDCHSEGRLDPGKAKVSIYKYLEFEQTIYLDVDGMCIRDLQGLFDLCQGKEYATQGDAMHWQGIDKIKEKYDLPEDAEIHGLNSSFQFIKQGKTCETIFTEARMALTESPFKIHEMTNNWFNRQPDELYLAVGMAKAGINEPYLEALKYPIYFRQKSKYGPTAKMDELQKIHYVIGSYGSDRFNHVSIARMYNKYMNDYSGKVSGHHIYYKLEKLMQNKARVK